MTDPFVVILGGMGLFMMVMTWWIATGPERERRRRRPPTRLRWDSTLRGGVRGPMAVSFEEIRATSIRAAREAMNADPSEYELISAEVDRSIARFREDWRGDLEPRPVRLFLEDDPRIDAVNYGSATKCAGLPVDHACGPVIAYMKHDDGPARWYYCEEALVYRRTRWIGTATDNDGWTFTAVDAAQVAREARALKRGKDATTLPALPDIIRRSRRSL